jgi:hypothetical protein
MRQRRSATGLGWEAEVAAERCAAELLGVVVVTDRAQNWVAVERRRRAAEAAVATGKAVSTSFQSKGLVGSTKWLGTAEMLWIEDAVCDEERGGGSDLASRTVAVCEGLDWRRSRWLELGERRDASEASKMCGGKGDAGMTGL